MKDLAEAAQYYKVEILRGIQPRRSPQDDMCFGPGFSFSLVIPAKAGIQASGDFLRRSAGPDQHAVFRRAPMFLSIC